MKVIMIIIQRNVLPCRAPCVTGKSSSELYGDIDVLYVKKYFTRRRLCVL